MEQQARRVIERDFLGVGSFIIWPEPVPLHTVWRMKRAQETADRQSSIERNRFDSSPPAADADWASQSLHWHALRWWTNYTRKCSLSTMIAPSYWGPIEPPLTCHFHYDNLHSIGKDVCTFVHYVFTKGTPKFNATGVSVEVPKTVQRWDFQNRILNR